MRKLIHFVCMILTFSLLLAVPAQADTVAETRGSAFFSSYSTDLYKTSSTSFQIWFDVTSNVDTMDELGVSEIVLYRSADQQSWSRIKTYSMNAYAVMVEEDTTFHGGCVDYNFATSGYYYTARITFYAKNSTGIGERDVYTEILRM